LAEAGVERTDFVCVPVTDKAAALKFYGETLGIARNERAHEDWPEFETGNLTLAIIDPKLMGREFSPNPWPIALRVGDVASTREALEAAGVVFRGETLDTGVCHMAVFSDPDGNALMLHRRYAPYADGTTP
jgi:predicted enzyme related to lactoylglutathione lyase